MVTENTVNNLSSALRQLSDAFHRASVACKDLEYTIPLLAAGVDLASDTSKQTTQAAAPPEKRKRIKDPNEPRRPPSGYLLFLQKARQELPKTDSELKPSEIMSKMAAMWKDLDESQKKEEAKQLKVEYDREFEQYEKDHPEIQKKRRRNKPQPNPSTSPSRETQRKAAAPTTTTPAKESKAQSKKDVSPKSERKPKEKEKEKEKEKDKDKDKDKKKRRKTESKSKDVSRSK